LLCGGELLFCGCKIVLCHTRCSIDGVELKFRDIAGFEERLVTFEISLGAFIGCPFRGDFGLRL
jgi:hypothetical protein